MKKSTRLLALLLCVVMMATLLPTFAFALEPDQVSYTLVDPDKTLEKDIFAMSDDRYTINVNPGYTDKGYGYNTTYFIPRVGTGSDATETVFYITRSANDINRWWRWGIEGTLYSQEKSNDEVGYSKSWTTGVTGMDAKIVWQTEEYEGVWPFGHSYTESHDMEVSKDSARARKYIRSKVIRRWCYRWAGGSKNNSATVEVTVDRNLKIPCSSVLWSANGTDEQQGVRYGETVVHATKPASVGIIYYEDGHYVHHGDPGQNFIRMVEPRYVSYDLDGGNFSGNTNNPKYVCWTTGIAKTSQKHELIAAPTKTVGDTEYVFQGWQVLKVDSDSDNGLVNKILQPGVDLNNGILGNVWLKAIWKEKVVNPDYSVSFNGNGATSGTMENQGMFFNKTAELFNNMYVREFTLYFYMNDGKTNEETHEENVGARTRTDVDSQFMGWEDRGGITTSNGTYYNYEQFDAPTYGNMNADVKASEDFGHGVFDKVGLANHYELFGAGEGRAAISDPRGTYPNNAAVEDLTDAETIKTEGNVVPLYAQWNDQIIKLPTPDEREITEDDSKKDIVAWRFDGWYSDPSCNDASFIGLAGHDYKVSANANMYAKWTPIKNTKFNVVHVTNGVAGKPTEYDTDKVESLNMPGLVTSGYLYGGTFLDEKCTSIASNNPENMSPSAGQTYYIWEVTNEHLQPLTLNTWANVTEGYDVTNVYLLTAIDRLQYSEAGFYIDGKQTKVPGKDNSVAYDKVGVQVGGNTIPMTYIQLNPLAKTTDGSKVVCYELDGFKSGSHTMQPYWVTLDGWEVKGQNTRTIIYNGAGNEYKNKLITVEDTNQMYSVPTPAKYVRNAPMMLMSCFNPSQSTPITVPEPQMLNVVDGENAYEVEITNDLALTPAGQDGKLFIGWYTDEAYTKIADLNNVEDGDTVYAKYISDSYLQVKYSFSLLSKKLSLTSAVDSKDYAETGYVISTKNGDKTVAVSKYATTFALQNANKLFGVEKNAPLMNVDYKLSGLSKNDTVTVTPYLVTADGTTVYGTARTLTYTGLTMKG